MSFASKFKVALSLALVLGTASVAMAATKQTPRAAIPAQEQTWFNHQDLNLAYGYTNIR